MQKPNVEITCTSVIRSMSRAGFSQEEIYDTITGMGVSDVDVQILLDRVKADLDTVEFESRVSRLSREVEEIIEVKLEQIMIEINSEMRILGNEVNSMKNSLDRLESRIAELQSICTCGFDRD